MTYTVSFTTKAGRQKATGMSREDAERVYHGLKGLAGVTHVFIVAVWSR